MSSYGESKLNTERGLVRSSRSEDGNTVSRNDRSTNIDLGSEPRYTMEDLADIDRKYKIKVRRDELERRRGGFEQKERYYGARGTDSLLKSEERIEAWEKSMEAKDGIADCQKKLDDLSSRNN